ncbi:hypothetical protein CI109_103545 [Kwoniella shandongensis]|uniref:RING-type domain-containing protein n=1 Tax=Kwoniella shandongensis TaxID=1734106 RepID=A0AAJ8LJV4_9TREE
MPSVAPFWLCHECGAQMRPVTVDNVPHCASCNGEFIEILDPEVNPDPFHDLPPPPPTRPGQQPTSPPRSARSSASPGPAPGEGGASFFSSLFGNFLGAAASNQNQNQGPGSEDGLQTSASGSQGNSPSRNTNTGQGGARTFTFNFPGGGRGQVVFGSMGGGGGGGGMGPFGPAGNTGANPFESFFPPEFAPPRRTDQQGQRLGGPGDPLDGTDLLRALFAVLGEEGQMPPHMMFGGPAGRANFGDYATSEQGFNDILERLMQAAGPQGPLPATDVVIEGLPRFKFEDEKALAQSTYKDCPVCKDDFVVGDEVMRIPCAHVFHPDCLQPWLKVNGSCPVCRFSLVPEDADRQTQSQASNTQGQTSQQPNQTPSEVGGGAASAVTSILNRLFGQSGTTSNPTSPGVTEPQQTPFGSVREQAQEYQPQGQASTSTSQTQAPSHAQRQATTQSGDQPPSTSTHRTGANESPSALPTSGQVADPIQPSLSTAIPEDYRARHRERERLRHQEQEHAG